MGLLIGRLLRSAIPAAMVMGLIGLGYQQMARMMMPGDAVQANTMTRAVPVTMAAWGFGLSVLFGLLGQLWRGTPVAVAAQAVVAPIATGPSGLDPEVEKLLTQLTVESEKQSSVAVGQVHQEAILEEIAVADEREFVGSSEFPRRGNPPA